jgi:SAM-dependent methyltransferase
LAQEQTSEAQIKIDIGCGGVKREGFIGLDSVAGPAVDYVLDLTKDRLPFEDATVDHVFSSHFLEHIRIPFHLFKEIARVCKDGARIEFWTPYAFSNEAFLYGHEVLLTEETWMHFYRDTWAQVMCGRWLIVKINYVVLAETEQEILANGFSVDFAIRYFKSVVAEFGVEMEFRRDPTLAPVIPQRTYSYNRLSERFPLTSEVKRWQPRKLLTLIPAGLRKQVGKLLYR